MAMSEARNWKRWLAASKAWSSGSTRRSGSLAAALIILLWG
ncbi:hypothetical protein [Kitasatospora sp. Root107]|nr:hypothetical protein [Kitasatospora sp. Root107]